MSTHYKRIWFKPDMIKWILEGKKTTTFRSRRHEGLYEIDLGSRFKPKPSGIRLRLTPMSTWEREQVISYCFDTEGDFNTDFAFAEWLEINKLELPDCGWLHKIEVLERGI